MIEKSQIQLPPFWIDEYIAIRDAMSDVGTQSPQHNIGPQPHVIMDIPDNPLIDGVRYNTLVETMAAAMIAIQKERITITDFTLMERGFTRLQMSFAHMQAAARSMNQLNLL